MGWQEELDVLKKRSIAKGKFTRKVTLLDEGMKKGDQLSVLSSNNEQILETFRNLEDTNDVLNFVCQ